jgi:hypothetical protein
VSNQESFIEVTFEMDFDNFMMIKEILPERILQRQLAFFYIHQQMLEISEWHSVIHRGGSGIPRLSPPLNCPKDQISILVQHVIYQDTRLESWVSWNLVSM